MKRLAAIPALAAMAAAVPANACADVPSIVWWADYAGNCEQLLIQGQDRAGQCPDSVRLLEYADRSAVLVYRTWTGDRVTGRVTLSGRFAAGAGGDWLLLVSQVTDTVIEPGGDQPSETVQIQGSCALSSPLVATGRVDCNFAADGPRTAFRYALNRTPQVERFDVPYQEVAQAPTPCANIRL